METLKINYVGNLPKPEDETVLTVSSEADYCLASRLLRDNLADGIGSMWVSDPHLFAWLKAQVEHAGLSLLRPVEFHRATPSSLLAELWGVEIPAWLTDELILAEGLLDKGLPAESTSAANGLLEPLFGPLPDTLAAKAVGPVAEAASRPEVVAALGQPLLAAAWEAILERWSGEEVKPGNTGAWRAACCARLRENPEALWRDLTLWRLLCRYPAQIAGFALDTAAEAFVKGLPPEAWREMSLSPEGRKLALDQIKMAIEALGKEAVTRTKFTAFLEAVSGELPEEFGALEALLERAEFEVAEEDLQAVRSRFANCGDISPTRLSRLDLHVRPPKPEAIEESAPGPEDWTRWALEQYLPYRWWQIQRREADPEVEKSVAAFSAWYCENHGLVHGDPNLSAIQALSRWRGQILADQVSLVLMVDNLPWFFWEILERALASAGLHRHESAPVFVPLPSVTAISKPLLVAGEPMPPGTNYRKLLEARSAAQWQGRASTYTMGVDQIDEFAFPVAPCVVLLNYLASDEALHSDAGASGSSWTDQLELLFGKLAEAVGNFARRAAETGGGFGLYVLTDHGSTLILPEERESVDAQLANKLFPNEKHRSATLSEAEAEQIPNNLWKLGHRHVSPLAGGVHFIPRGHNTVASGGKRASFSHGGATPEEVIVPAGLFRLHPAAWSPPKLRFVDLELKAGRASFYIKRVSTITIEIQNPNNEPLRLESLAISPEIAEVRGFGATVVPAKGTGRTEVSLYFGEHATSAEKATFALGFRVGQDALAQSIELPLTISSATSSGLDLNDLF